MSRPCQSTLFTNSDIFLFGTLTLLHSERPKLYAILAYLSAIGLNGFTKYSLTFQAVFQYLSNQWHSTRFSLVSVNTSEKEKNQSCLTPNNVNHFVSVFCLTPNNVNHLISVFCLDPKQCKSLYFSVLF